MCRFLCVYSCLCPSLTFYRPRSMFIIDRSGSMSGADRRPLADTPVTAKINQHSSNRLGAVYSSLHGFWSSRQAVVNAPGAQTRAGRRDAYSIVFFNGYVSDGVMNDFSSTPEQLLDSILANRAGGGTNFTAALNHGKSVMERHWSTER